MDWIMGGGFESPSSNECIEVAFTNLHMLGKIMDLEMWHGGLPFALGYHHDCNKYLREQFKLKYLKNFFDIHYYTMESSLLATAVQYIFYI